MAATSRFEKWGLGFSGCDGGDIGSAESPSVWVCGIEWGGGHDPDSLDKHIDEDVTLPSKGYQDWLENLKFRFNWQVMKLLSVIHGGSVADYKVYAEKVRPFSEGSSGYFKMNLYPIGFKDTNPARWHDQFTRITGFNNKAEYFDWCQSERFPAMRKWVETYRPKLIICLGKTYRAEFSAAFLEKGISLSCENIDDRDLFWGKSASGSLVVILPFMTNRNGLNKNVSIQKFGIRIAELIKIHELIIDI